MTNYTLTADATLIALNAPDVTLTYAAIVHPPSGWTPVTEQAETWTDSPKQAETWTPKGVQSETWSNKTVAMRGFDPHGFDRNPRFDTGPLSGLWDDVTIQSETWTNS